MRAILVPLLTDSIHLNTLTLTSSHYKIQPVKLPGQGRASQLTPKGDYDVIIDIEILCQAKYSLSYLDISYMV